MNDFNIVDRLKKRVVIAIAEPVAVAVAAAVEQTLSRQDSRITALHERLEEAFEETLQARRERDERVRELQRLALALEASTALATLASKVVHDIVGTSGVMESIAPQHVAQLRKLEQLADIVLGEP